MSWLKLQNEEMDSKLFTKAELKSLRSRAKGSYKDPTGIFSSRVKPKILELLNWFKDRDKLEKAIKNKNETKTH